MNVSLHQLLKDSTREKHNQAEGHPFQGSLTQGKLPFPSYCDYLVQLRALHHGIESKVHNHMSDPALKKMMLTDYDQLPFVEADLKALNISASSKPTLECINEFCSLPAFDQTPVTLLGPTYVLLGSKHGAKFIAHNVKSAYSLQNGYSYFDPYGHGFMDLWKRFTAGLNELQLNETERQTVVDAADATFEVFGKIGEAIWASMPVDASVHS